MKVVQSTLALLLAVFSSEVCGRVCYPGQEPSPSANGRYFRWVLNEESPAECTKFRPGGLNTLPYRKLHGVVIGSDRDLQNLDRLDTGRAESINETTPAADRGCETFTTDPRDSVDYFTKRFDSTLERLEFGYAVLGSSFDPKAKLMLMGSDDHPLFLISFSRTDSIGAFLRPNGTVAFSTGVTFPGRLWLTFSGGDIEVGKHGTQKPLLSFNDTSAVAARLESIGFYSSVPTEWRFYRPCF